MTANPANADVSKKKNEHLKWLVKSRSQNQKSAFRIRQILREYNSKVMDEPGNQNIADDLVAINFSLWRAVFLTELEAGIENVIPHALKFLDELIENNTITYNQDKNSKEWSFIYYMLNAKFRLDALNSRRPDILSESEYNLPEHMGDKEWWTHHQKALNKAAKNFGRFLRG